MVKIPEPISAEQARFRRLKMKKLDWLHWVLLVVILAQGFYLWVTPYQYRSWRGSLVRINKFSGKTEVLNSADGWKMVGLRESPTPRRKLELIKNQKTGQYALFDRETESIFMYLESSDSLGLEPPKATTRESTGKVRELQPGEKIDP